MDDIRAGVDRIRRLKFGHAKVKTATGKVQYSKYSLGDPPPVFIRKALESDEEDVQTELLPKEEVHVKGHNGYRRKKYEMRKDRSPRKPRITE